jgi:hypothetical protein
MWSPVSTYVLEAIPAPPLTNGRYLNFCSLRL